LQGAYLMKKLLVCILQLMVVVCIGMVAIPTMGQTDYVLGSGDKLKVTVFGNEDLSGETEVDPSGQVTLPLIQQVPAAGKTVPQLEAEIRHRLSPDFVKNPRLSIEVLNYRPFYIIGEVKNPGSYPYVAGMTVVNAIALAGGFTYRANKDEVQILHAADSAHKPAPAARNEIVLPGDVIEVKERLF
jgi:protein involved in polysaccharide export with SLBB domain